ncbi:hypothetical protein Hypma_001417 [Hypsizygus marmoreus]|uniref:Uncharacterized protein n=1 Tax=Hypsizygus marmoreus TaxID=39966 RepID=A0A369K0Z0_HYPMA|nr:hypothetical protein Hypma_001417 [Hypsizygus marmoreus]
MSRIPRSGEFWKIWTPFLATASVEVQYKAMFDELGLKHAHKCALPELKQSVRQNLDYVANVTMLPIA